MVAVEGWFVQSIACQGQEIDLAMVESCTYIETMDLGGPKMIVTFRDEDAFIRDEIGLCPGAVLDVTFADYFHDEGDELVEQMAVLSMPDAGDTITLNCMASAVWALKTPAVRARAWVRQPAAAILRSFFSPPIRVDAGRFPMRCDYHLLPGDRPSKMLRQLSSELGARIFYCRKRVYAETLRDLWVKPDHFILGYNDTRRGHESDYKIIGYDRPNTQMLVSDAIDRRWCGWNMVEGMLYADGAHPPELCHADSLPVLNSLSEVPQPEVDFIVAGMGQLRPGMALGANWYLNRIDAPIDESLPPRLIVGVAAHHYQAQKYITRIKGLVPRWI